MCIAKTEKSLEIGLKKATFSFMHECVQTKTIVQKPIIPDAM